MKQEGNNYASATTYSPIIQDTHYPRLDVDPQPFILSIRSPNSRTNDRYMLPKLGTWVTRWSLGLGVGEGKTAGSRRDHLRYTISPPRMVISTTELRICAGGIFMISADNTTASASFPASKEPTMSSSNAA